MNFSPARSYRSQARLWATIRGGPVTDEQLALASQAGRPAALAALAERGHGPLLGYLVRLTGERSLAEDLAQDTLLRLLGGIG